MQKHGTLKSLAIALAMTLGSAAAAQAQMTVNMGTGSRPESVTQGWGGAYFASCQGGGTLGLNDGSVKTFDTAGNVSVFVDGLDNPRGITFTGEYLVVTDTTKIWKIDRHGNKSILAEASQFPFPVAFFNDVTAEKGGRAVYVAEMGSRTVIRDAAGFLVPPDSAQAWAVPSTSRVYRVTMSGQISEEVAPSRKVLIMNGVQQARKGNNLLIAEFFFGNIVVADKHKGKDRLRIIATGFRGADGIDQAKDGTIYVSSFENGAVWKMDKKGENITNMISGVGRQSTADMYLDEAMGLLLVADTAHGTVIVLPTN
jgi:hypothetical protein